MNPALFALVFGIVSGLSLPIGAACGIVLSPVSGRVCSMMMAFGAGALVFAVTVEIYGHALKEMMAGRSGMLGMMCTVIGALLGCAFYLESKEWLESQLEPSHDDSEKGSGLRLSGLRRGQTT